MAINFTNLEATLNRVATAINPITDRQTAEDLKQLSYVIGEVRHAATSLDQGTPILDVEERLMRSLFMNSSRDILGKANEAK